MQTYADMYTYRSCCIQLNKVIHVLIIYSCSIMEARHVCYMGNLPVECHV